MGFVNINIAERLETNIETRNVVIADENVSSFVAVREEVHGNSERRENFRLRPRSFSTGNGRWAAVERRG